MLPSSVLSPRLVRREGPVDFSTKLYRMPDGQHGRSNEKGSYRATQMQATNLSPFETELQPALFRQVVAMFCLQCGIRFQFGCQVFFRSQRHGLAYQWGGQSCKCPALVGAPDIEIRIF